MPENILVKNPNIVTRQEKDEALLFNPQDGNLLCINQTGIFIWNLCNGKNNQESIIDKMLVEYQINSIDKVRKDVDSFIKELGKVGFIGKKI